MGKHLQDQTSDAKMPRFSQARGEALRKGDFMISFLWRLGVTLAILALVVSCGGGW
jgi:hypothetical protein